MFSNRGYAWWVSRDSTKMTYWGGASPGSGKCACGMTNSCAKPSDVCNCDKNDDVWREESGLLTDKTKLPVIELRFGDTAWKHEGGGLPHLGKVYVLRYSMITWISLIKNLLSVVIIIIHCYCCDTELVNQLRIFKRKWVDGISLFCFWFSCC